MTKKTLEPISIIFIITDVVRVTASSSSSGSRIVSHDSLTTHRARASLHTHTASPNSTLFSTCGSIDMQKLRASNALQCFDAVGWVTGRASGL